MCEGKAMPWWLCPAGGVVSGMVLPWSRGWRGTDHTVLPWESSRSCPAAQRLPRAGVLPRSLDPTLHEQRLATSLQPGQGERSGVGKSRHSGGQRHSGGITSGREDGGG